MNCEYVKHFYSVPACIGRRVIAYGEHGIIAEDRGHYIGVNLDKDKPGVIKNYHPVDGMVYCDMGCVSWRICRMAAGRLLDCRRVLNLLCYGDEMKIYPEVRIQNSEFRKNWRG